MKTISFFSTVLALSLHSDFVISAAYRRAPVHAPSKSAPSKTGPSKIQCPGTFTPISAADFVKTMSPGEEALNPP